MGFEKDISQVIEAINEKCPTKPQTVLLSATLSAGKFVAFLSISDSFGFNSAVICELVISAVMCHIFCGTGVERLAGMSLSNPEKIHITEDGSSKGSCPARTSPSDEQFAVPDGLQHHFVVVPSKLRLTTLTSFILWKCKVVIVFVCLLFLEELQLSFWCSLFLFRLLSEERLCLVTFD